jgi:hypothetical protein
LKNLLDCYQLHISTAILLFSHSGVECSTYLWAAAFQALPSAARKHQTNIPCGVEKSHVFHVALSTDFIAVNFYYSSHDLLTADAAAAAALIIIVERTLYIVRLKAASAKWLRLEKLFNDFKNNIENGWGVSEREKNSNQSN